MGNAISMETGAIFAAQLASYKAGFTTLGMFIADHSLLACDKDSRAFLYIRSQDVLRILRCIEADAADAAEQAKSKPSAEILQLLARCDNGEGRRLQRLEAAARALLRCLEALGFGDERAEISGADAVDAINEHFPALQTALA